MGRVKDLERIWLSKNANANARADGRETHAVSFKDFMEEILIVYKLTGDRRAFDARTALSNVIQEYGLKDKNSRWAKNIASWDDLSLPDYARAVRALIAKGMSKREACATVASRFAVPAATFEAAIAQVRRAWDRDLASTAAAIDTRDPPRNL